MGPGTIGLAATQVNCSSTRCWPPARARRGVVAELRVPADVSADRPVRRVDRHGGAARRVAARRRQEDSAAVRDTIADGLSLMMMLNVPATVGLIVLARADRAGHLRARRVHAVRHARDGRGAAVLRASAWSAIRSSASRRRRSTRSAAIARRSSSAWSTVLVNAVLNIVLVRAMGYPRPGARHVDRRAVQCHRAVRAAAPPARRLNERRVWSARSSRIVARLGRDGTGRRRGRPQRSTRGCPAATLAAADRALGGRRSASRWSRWRGGVAAADPGVQRGRGDWSLRRFRRRAR